MKTKGDSKKKSKYDLIEAKAKAGLYHFVPVECIPDDELDTLQCTEQSKVIRQENLWLIEGTGLTGADIDEIADIVATLKDTDNPEEAQNIIKELILLGCIEKKECREPLKNSSGPTEKGRNKRVEFIFNSHSLFLMENITVSNYFLSTGQPERVSAPKVERK